MELRFKKLERDVIARGIFTSTTDLRRKLMRYIVAPNHNPRPTKWSYTDPTRRSHTNYSPVTVQPGSHLIRWRTSRSCVVSPT
jgi:hypothetical protein